MLNNTIIRSKTLISSTCCVNVYYTRALSTSTQQQQRTSTTSTKKQQQQQQRKVVSKRIFDQLLREKVEWETATSPEFANRMNKPFVANNYGVIKQDINRMVHEVRMLIAPNTDKLVDTNDALEAYEQVVEEMEEMISKLRNEATEVANAQSEISTTPALSNSAVVRMILNRPDLNKKPTQRLIDELSMDDARLAHEFSNELPENINDLQTLKERLIDVRKRIKEIEDDAEDEDDDDEQTESYDLMRLRDIKLRLYRRREQLRAAQDIDPRQKETRRGKLFERPGDVPLYDFARMKLDESTNTKELKDMERQMDLIQEAKKMRESKRRQ
ncbi:hypothetical protein SAMD00019534_042760 [Acytostelium subglobosum LB1]|uniref:hypothetical protein n=1 Tax=Acytostelium subglobosum LB1 TaxID=1410327 RepID=UPI0006451B27|nr:hypothetical protein SAMD00019534_042760 [Acytostelium subglobosum LB1]GAM21101.1 hypothetical protein SAMD00019534_042760 [Acytostelium subglobosum LB1]|eukprot:XP_012756235.1 hypothetical protein SAMD00019534_042760 [Acytostelium subglobosum LB1]